MATPYYSDEAVTLYLGDCRDVLPMFEPLPELYWVDHIITDPPYESEAHTLQRRVQHEKDRKGGGRVMKIESLPFDPVTDELREFIAEKSLARRWVLTFCQIEAAPTWRKAYEAAGYVYKRTCIWVKPDGMPQYTGDRPGMGYEGLLAMHAMGKSKWNGGGRHGVFVQNKNDGISGANPHPTQKPLKLMSQLVALFTDPGEMVLDPFAGSGTTLRACKDLGRRAIGIEVNEAYAEIAAKRMSQSVMNFSGGK